MAARRRDLLERAIKMGANKKAVIEAVLFMSNEPVTFEKILKLLHTQKVEEVQSILKGIQEELKKEEHGIHLLETKEGWALKVKAEFQSLVRPLTPYQDLSRGLLKVLALVAYKQPITQSEIVKVIGNRTYEYVKILQEKGLINTIKTGRTKALVATKEFAEYFGLETPEDARKLFESISPTKEKQD